MTGALAAALRDRYCTAPHCPPPDGWAHRCPPVPWIDLLAAAVLAPLLWPAVRLVAHLTKPRSHR